MTKADLVERVAEERVQDVSSKAGAARIVDTVLEAIAETLEGGNEVSIGGFGTFKVKDRAERQGRKPVGDQIDPQQMNRQQRRRQADQNGDQQQQNLAGDGGQQIDKTHP